MTLPISGLKKEFGPSGEWLDELARRELVAVRLGQLKFRGFVERGRLDHGTPLTDADYKPSFVQKGVDLRIGLDIANFAANRAVERIVVITNDIDLVPAFKYARRAGLQVALVSLLGQPLAADMLPHADFGRAVV
ncbi:MAG: NYN domain-containing protein [bacterium]